MADITQGTVEYLLFDWTELLNTLTSIDGTSPQYDVKDATTGFSYYTNQTSSNVGMTQYCLIDTTTSPVGSPSAGGVWVLGEYRIWVRLTANLGLEKPRRGHFSFNVIT